MGAGGLGLWLLAAAVLATAPAAAQERGSVPAPVPAPVSVPASVPAPVSAPASAGSRSALPVLLAPVQGTQSLRAQQAPRVTAAVRRALEAHGYQVSASKELLGQTVVACQTPECVEQALDAAGAGFAIVPAIWSRESGGEEVTLTLVRRSGRSLNASAMVRDDLPGTTGGLVEELLRRAELGAVTSAGTRTDTPAEARARRAKPGATRRPSASEAKGAAGRTTGGGGWAVQPNTGTAPQDSRRQREPEGRSPAQRAGKAKRSDRRAREDYGRGWAGGVTNTGAGTGTATGTATGTRGRPRAWMAGPIVLIGGGVAAFVAIGVSAGVKSDNQQLNTAAVAAWATIGAAAIAGGAAWWVVGERRRRPERESAGALAPEIALRPTKIDLRLRF